MGLIQPDMMEIDEFFYLGKPAFPSGKGGKPAIFVSEFHPVVEIDVHGAEARVIDPLHLCGD